MFICIFSNNSVFSYSSVFSSINASIHHNMNRVIISILYTLQPETDYIRYCSMMYILYIQGTMGLVCSYAKH